jgi:hypothetical protein
LPIAAKAVWPFPCAAQIASVSLPISLDAPETLLAA